jgi:hypothetical protein
VCSKTNQPGRTPHRHPGFHNYKNSYSQGRATRSHRRAPALPAYDGFRQADQQGMDAERFKGTPDRAAKDGAQAPEGSQPAD